MENTHGHFKTGSDMLPVFFQGILRLGQATLLNSLEIKTLPLGLKTEDLTQQNEA